jgi:hypothetical protein
MIAISRFLTRAFRTLYGAFSPFDKDLTSTSK